MRRMPRFARAGWLSEAPSVGGALSDTAWTCVSLGWAEGRGGTDDAGAAASLHRGPWRFGDHSDFTPCESLASHIVPRRDNPVTPPIQPPTHPSPSAGRPDHVRAPAPCRLQSRSEHLWGVPGVHSHAALPAEAPGLQRGKNRAALPHQHEGPGPRAASQAGWQWGQRALSQWQGGALRGVV